MIIARGSGLWVYFNGPNGYGTPVIVGPVSTTDPGVAPGQRGVRFQDVNGDGLIDALVIGDTFVKAYLGRGDGTFETQSAVSFPWKGLGDVDHIQLADLNRDGLLDLIQITGAAVSLYFGRADGTFDPTARPLATPSGLDSSVIVTVADANGNGSQDILWCTPTRMVALDLAGPTSAGMLATVDNGLGKSIAFTYQASSVLAMADENAGLPWVQKLPMSIPVPLSLTSSPGGGDLPRLVRYAVRDAFWDPAERRFGGFLEGRKTLDAGTPNQRVEITHYVAGLNAARVLRGKPLWIRVEVAGQPVMLSEYSWQVLNVDGLPTDNPLLRRAALAKETETRYEGVATPLQTVTTYAYDGEARPIEEHRLGRGI